MDRCLDRLLQAQNMLDTNGLIEGRIHRFLLTAVKPKIFTETSVSDKLTREKFGNNPGKIREKSGKKTGKIRERHGNQSVL